MRGCCDRERQSPQYRHTHVKAQQLDGDLPLIVVHADGAIVLLVAHSYIERIGGKRAVGAYIHLTGALDGGPDDLDFLAPDLTSIAGMRIDRRDRDAGFLKTGFLQSAIGKRDCLDDAFYRQQICDLAQWHMGRDPCVPHAVDDVEFAGAPLAAQTLPGPLQLVFGIEARSVHGPFVEGHEANAIDRACLSEVEGFAEPLQHGATGRNGHLAERNVAWIDSRNIEKVGYLFGEVHVVDSRNRFDQRTQSCDVTACAKHPLVRHNQNIRACPYLLVVE